MQIQLMWLFFLLSVYLSACPSLSCSDDFGLLDPRNAVGIFDCLSFSFQPLDCTIISIVFVLHCLVQCLILKSCIPKANITLPILFLFLVYYYFYLGSHFSTPLPCLILVIHHHWINFICSTRLFWYSVYVYFLFC